MKILTCYPLGFRFIDKVKACLYRIVGCSHPIKYVIDASDEDRQAFFCVRCGQDIDTTDSRYIIP